jgi:four helix bundle protein
MTDMQNQITQADVPNKNLILDKSFSFALQIVGLNRMLIKRNEFVLSKQVLRSGTAIGALVREAQYGESKKDFVHKLAIAIKEANETAYWLELLFGSQLIDHETFQPIHTENQRLLRILTAIIKKAKQNL